MTDQAITILGIVVGSGTIIIVALVGYIGKGLNARIETVFEEFKKYRTTEVCRLKHEMESERNERIRSDINGVGKKIENHIKDTT